MVKIASRPIDPRADASPLIARELRGETDVAEFTTCVGRCALGRFAACDPVGDRHVEMRSQLIRELVGASCSSPRQQIDNAFESV